ncbi:MAG: M16 family metallopeptidase [Gemmatimonadaceae bacterium]
MQDEPFGSAHLMEHVVANNGGTIPGPARPSGINAIEGNALTRPYYTSFVSVVPPALLASTIHSRMARMGRTRNDSSVFSEQVQRVVAELERDMSGRYPAYKSVVAISRGASPRIADELEFVRNTNKEQLAAAIAPIFLPVNAVMVITGDLDLDSTRAIVHESEARLRLNELASRVSPGPKSPPAFRMGESAIVPNQNRTTQTIVGIAWQKPPLGDGDQLPLMIADEILLGRTGPVNDPGRSDSTALALRLARSLGGSGFWDGRAGMWGTPDMVDIGPGIYAIVFKTDRKLTPAEVRDSVTAALRDVRLNGMSDKQVDAARDNLAAYYERWMFEPTYRVLSDHLMAYAATGRNPADVKNIPADIRRVRPASVRRALERYLIDAPSNVVILPPMPGQD